jgi:hypothetical protein
MHRASAGGWGGICGTARMTEKIQSSSQEKHTALLDEPLSRTDRFFITSMLGDEYPPTVFLSEDTIIGGSTLSSIMELGYFELCNDLKLTDPFHSMHLMYLLDLQKSPGTASGRSNRTRSNRTPETSISAMP